MLQILLGLDERECMPESFVLNDGRMAHTPIFIEDAVGKHLSLPAHLQSSIREVVEIDILAAKILGEGTAIQDELLAIVRQGQLLANMTLFAVTQDVAQPVRTHGQPAMQVVWPGGTYRELLIEALHARNAGLDPLWIRRFQRRTRADSSWV
jgi:hypothetical protein